MYTFHVWFTTTLTLICILTDPVPMPKTDCFEHLTGQRLQKIVWNLTNLFLADRGAYIIVLHHELVRSAIFTVII